MSRRNAPEQRYVGRLQWIVVIIITLTLVGLGFVRYQDAVLQKRMAQSISSHRSILIACNTFANDWNGFYPFPDPQNSPVPYASSVAVFNQLIPDYIDSESTFWVQTENPLKLKPPVEDGKLQHHECSYGYVTGQVNVLQGPLTMDGEMSSPGVYGEYHPWLPMERCVVGFIDGHVKPLPLSSSKPGAVALSEDRSTPDIFLPHRRNILLPQPSIR